MQEVQMQQTMYDIAALYERDIGVASTELNGILMQERSKKRPPFDTMHRKTQLSNLNIIQKWELHRRLLLDWMHYQTRCIVPLPRQVFRSEKLKSDDSIIIKDIENDLIQGKSLKPRVSRAVLKNIKRKDFKSDPLLWHWNIHHFHLGDFDPTLGYAVGTDELLFAYIDEHRAILLGFGTHDDIGNQWLFDAVFDTVPELIPHFELLGINCSENFSDEKRKILWKRRVNTAIRYKKHTLISPGNGTLANGYSGRILQMQSRLFTVIKIFDDNNPCTEDSHENLSLKFDRRRLIITHKNNPIWAGKALV